MITIGATCERCGKTGVMRYNHVETDNGLRVWCIECFTENSVECEACKALYDKEHAHECKGEKP